MPKPRRPASKLFNGVLSYGAIVLHKLCIIVSCPEERLVIQKRLWAAAF